MIRKANTPIATVTTARYPERGGAAHLLRLFGRQDAQAELDTFASSDSSARAAEHVCALARRGSSATLAAIRNAPTSSASLLPIAAPITPPMTMRMGWAAEVDTFHRVPTRDMRSSGVRSCRKLVIAVFTVAEVARIAVMLTVQRTKPGAPAGDATIAK